MRESTLLWLFSSFERGLRWALPLSVVIGLVVLLVDVSLASLVALGPIVGVLSCCVYSRFETSDEFWFTRKFKKVISRVRNFSC